MFRRRPFRRLLLSVHRHQRPLPTLPDDIFELIFSLCTRLALYNCCLANRTLNRLAVAYLYDDPFGLDRPGSTADVRYDFFAHYQIPRRLSKLCSTILQNPDLARLVRVFRGIYWRDQGISSAKWEAVLSKLQNITTVSLRAPDTNAFVPRQPSSRIRTVYVDKYLIEAWFSRWLSSQRRIQALDLNDAYICHDDVIPIAGTNLQRLWASYQLASLILPCSPPSITYFKGLTPQATFGALFELLRHHARSVRTVAVEVDCTRPSAQADVKISHEALVLSHVYGLPELENLEVQFDNDVQTSIDAEGLLLVVSSIREGCPKLQDVRWIADGLGDGNTARVKGYEFTLVEGSWIAI
ncbi:hypothetical protein FRB97_004237 [Tulasnella sp. 331]|nr:hypothetical protein FRB97_004237 [Tulasnella sp. 331]